MPKSIPPLTLKQEEQKYLERFVNQGKRSARAIKRARILLYRHVGKTPTGTSELAEVSLGTVCNVSARYHAEGLQAALEEKPRSGQPVKLNLRQQAELTMLACVTVYPPLLHVPTLEGCQRGMVWLSYRTGEIVFVS